MAKYIKCDWCGKKIMFGERAYHKDFCGVFCSEECFFEDCGSQSEVDEDFIIKSDKQVYTE
jgi:hypothetical protein